MSRREKLQAAGAVVVRGEGAEREFLAVHRPKYDDWSLPKGKLEAGELPPVAAVREVAEETGTVVALDLPLGTTQYEVRGQPKRVHYWRASVMATVGHAPDLEVDRVRWIKVASAAASLTYPGDAELVAQAVAAPATTPLVITRHGKAMERKRWAHRDSARPITHRGRHQAREVAKVLTAFGVMRITSSSSNRCVATVLPYATQRHLPIERATILSEERGVDDRSGVGRFMEALARSCADTGIATVVCGHRPVLPHMLEGLGLPDEPFRTGESAIINVGADYEIHSVERIRTVT
ncbi:NUDIX hydrolase [Mariniluteicoccus endophyticus]